jgi:hypothetical protein
MSYIICYGSPVDGYTFVGPFADRDDAVEYAEFDGRDYVDWCIAELDQPDGETK